MVNVLHIEVLSCCCCCLLSLVFSLFLRPLGKVFSVSLSVIQCTTFLVLLSPIPTTVYYATTILLLHVCTMIEEEEEEKGTALVAK